MIRHRIIFIGLVVTFGWNSSPDFIGEVLHYSAGFRYFPAGSATLSMKSDSLEDEMVYLLTSTVSTNSFLSQFYKVRDVVKSWLSPDNFSLKKTVQTIREGRYHQDNEASIFGDSLAVTKNHTIKLPGNLRVYFFETAKLSPMILASLSL